MKHGEAILMECPGNGLENPYSFMKNKGLSELVPAASPFEEDDTDDRQDCDYHDDQDGYDVPGNGAADSSERGKWI